MSDFLVKITKNELVDRLRVIQSRLANENEHSEALFIGMAIQVLAGEVTSVQVINVSGSVEDAILARIKRHLKNDPGFACGGIAR